MLQTQTLHPYKFIWMICLNNVSYNEQTMCTGKTVTTTEKSRENGSAARAVVVRNMPSTAVMPRCRLSDLC